MRCKIIGSSSAGNSYLLEAESETLILEVGVRMDKIKKALYFNFDKVVGALITHEHRDHSLSAQAVMNAGIDCYSSRGTFNALGLSGHRAKIIEAGLLFKVGGFRIKAFDVRHDCAQPFGYLISHEECGLICFLTDTFYCPYKFADVNHFVVEANFSEAIIRKKISEGQTARFLRNRIIQSHFSIENCKEFLLANNLSKVQTITLIHLSDAHSDELDFKRQIEECTGKTTYIADKGMNINLSINRF